MSDVAALIAKRDDLESSRFAGVRQATYSDGSAIEYKSDAEMRAAIDELNRQIALASGAPRIAQVRISSSKGL